MLGVIALGGRLVKNERINEFLSAKYFAVAADSGMAHFDMLGILPDILVGDFDSINPEMLEKCVLNNIEIKQFDIRKDFTDSEIAVKAALEKGCDRLLFLGAFGSRLDHMLSNQMMAVSLSLKGIPVIMTDGITFMYTITKNESPFIYPLKSLIPDYDIISVIAMTPNDATVSLDGLMYNLKDSRIYFGTTQGVSNTVPFISQTNNANSINHENAVIDVKSGTILLIHTINDTYNKIN